MIVAQPQEEMVRALERQLGRLPIFPLQRVFLFPGSLLPLYVFEPRYREMTADSLKRGGEMAVALLLPGFEADYQGRPPVSPIAGAGKIVAHRENPDGTYNILLQGVARVRIEEELPPERSYREVRAALLLDQAPAGFDAAQAMATLGVLIDQLARQLARRLPRGGEDLRALLAEAHPPGAMADLLAAALLPDPVVRERLLGTADVPARLELVTQELARLLGRAAGPASN